MLESATLTNFQRHKNLTLEFSPNITTIIGETDAGKSSILRFIRWLSFNRPTGKACIHNECDTASGQLVVDGIELFRQIGRDSYYRLDTREFRAVGSSVPEDVQQFLNVSDINFQRQLDPPFWFSDSAGEVSRKLNAIVNLDRIDSCLDFLARGIRHESAAVQVAEEKLEKAKANKESLEYVPQLVEDVEQLYDLWRCMASKAAKLRQVATTVKLVSQHQSNLSRATAAKRTMKKLVACATSMREVQTKLEKVERYRGLVQETKRKLKQCRANLENQKNKIQEKTNGVCPICGGRMENPADLSQ